MIMNIRTIYLYLFSFVGLLTVVIGAVRMVDLGLKVFVFRDADRYEYSVSVPVDGKTDDVMSEQAIREQVIREQRRNRQREFSGAFAMLAVGLPLYLYHWKTIQKENRR